MDFDVEVVQSGDELVGIISGVSEVDDSGILMVAPVTEEVDLLWENAVDLELSILDTANRTIQDKIIKILCLLGMYKERDFFCLEEDGYHRDFSILDTSPVDVRIKVLKILLATELVVLGGENE